MIDVGKIASAPDLGALRDEWILLWDRCPAATPFQRPEWLLPWCEHLGRRAIRALALRAEGKLVGLAPFFVSEEGGERVLRILGEGVSDYLDALLDPEHAGPAARALAAHLAGRERWDRVELSDLAPGAALLGMPAPPGSREALVPASACPALKLPAPLEHRGLRRARARAARRGLLLAETAAGATRAELLAALTELHERRWATRGEGGVLEGAALQRFHADASAGLLAAGALRLHALRLDGRVIAVVYGFAAKGRAYLYLQGFDPDLTELSPGALVVGHAIEEAAREGLGEVDFLRGREAYKYRWGAVDRITWRRTFFGRAR